MVPANGYGGLSKIYLGIQVSRLVSHCMITSMDIAQRIATLNRIRWFSRLMDSAFRLPVIGVRFGLDPIIGLVPGAGDLVATGFSLYILYLATRFHLPGAVIRRMLFNIGLEAVVGTIPLFGDLFDAFYKSNIRNLALLEQYLQVAEPDLENADPLDLASTQKDVALQI